MSHEAAFRFDPGLQQHQLSSSLTIPPNINRSSLSNELKLHTYAREENTGATMVEGMEMEPINGEHQFGPSKDEQPMIEILDDDLPTTSPWSSELR